MSRIGWPHPPQRGANISRKSCLQTQTIIKHTDHIQRGANISRESCLQHKPQTIIKHTNYIQRGANISRKFCLNTNHQELIIIQIINIYSTYRSYIILTLFHIALWFNRFTFSGHGHKVFFQKFIYCFKDFKLYSKYSINNDQKSYLGSGIIMLE